MRRLFAFCFVLLSIGLSHETVGQEALSPKQAKAKFEKADRILNEAWAAVKAALPEAEFNKLKESQRAWVEYRDYLARSPLYSGTDAQGELALDSPEYLSAAAGLEEERAEWLKALVKPAEPEESLSGVWSDSFGGTLQIVEKDGKLHFALDCVRGPTSHIGSLAGVADWNQTIGWFSDKGREDGKDEVTNVSFTLRDKQLEVIGANTGYYHGARAYFDGNYVKTGKLSTQEQAELMQTAKTGTARE